MVFRHLFPALVCAVLVAASATVSAAKVEKVTFPTSQKYDGKPVTLKGELTKPDGEGPFPAVILMSGCAGWTPRVLQALRTHADHFAQNGFAVLNLDSFTPRGVSGGWVCKQIIRLSQARAYRARDAFEAMKYLKAQSFVDPDNIFLMGQSNGGSVAVLLSTLRDQSTYGRDVFRDDPPKFNAIAAYYPWCGAFGYYTKPVELASPIVVFGGDKDDWVPIAPCRKVETTGPDYVLHTYPNAPHSFDLEIEQQRYLGFLVGHDEEATKSSRREMVEFFKKHMAKKN